MRDPSSVPVQRLLALRRYPGFADADLGELAVLAENVVDDDYLAGRVVTRVGRVPSIHLIIEGSIELSGQMFGPRELVGALEAMAGRTIRTPMIATTDTRTLRLGAADFADILEDNHGLLSNVRRVVARRLLAVQRRRHDIARARPQVALATTGPLDLVDRLVALRHQRPFANAKIYALAALAEAAREVHWGAGETVVHAGDPARSMFTILDGALRVRGIDRVLGPGDVLGGIETLAEVPYHEHAETLTAVRALESPAIALFDVIEDHTDLALGMISNLAAELLDHPEHATHHFALDLDADRAN